MEIFLMGYDYRRFKTDHGQEIRKVFYVNNVPNDEEIVCYSEEVVDLSLLITERREEIKLVADAHSKSVLEVSKINFYDPR
jgi:hypothetical protein